MVQELMTHSFLTVTGSSLCPIMCSVRVCDTVYSSLSGWPSCGCAPAVNCLHNPKDSVRLECGCELPVKHVTLRLQQTIYTLNLVRLAP